MKKRKRIIVAVIGVITCLFIGLNVSAVNGQARTAASESVTYRAKSGVQLAKFAERTSRLMALCRSEAVRICTTNSNVQKAVLPQNNSEGNVGQTPGNDSDSELAANYASSADNQLITQNTGICNGTGHWNGVCDGSCIAQGVQSAGICDGTGNHAANCDGTCSYYNQGNTGSSSGNGQNQGGYTGAMSAQGYGHGGNHSSNHGGRHRR